MRVESIVEQARGDAAFADELRRRLVESALEPGEHEDDASREWRHIADFFAANPSELLKLRCLDAGEARKKKTRTTTTTTVLTTTILTVIVATPTTTTILTTTTITTAMD